MSPPKKCLHFLRGVGNVICSCLIALGLWYDWRRQAGVRAMGFDGNLHIFVGVICIAHGYRCGQARRAGSSTLLARHFCHYLCIYLWMLRCGRYYCSSIASISCSLARHNTPTSVLVCGRLEDETRGFRDAVVVAGARW